MRQSKGRANPTTMMEETVKPSTTETPFYLLMPKSTAIAKASPRMVPMLCREAALPLDSCFT